MQGNVIGSRRARALSCLGNVMLSASFLWMHKRGIEFALFTYKVES